MISKLAYVTNSRLPTEKAHGHQIVRMCREFADQGIEVSLIWPKRKNLVKEDLFSYYKVEKKFKIREIVCPDFIQFAKFLGPVSYFMQSLAFLSNLRGLKLDSKTAIFTRKPEIAWYFKKHGHKVAFECHDWFGRSKSLALFLLRKMDIIITTNSYIKEEFIKNNFPKEKILVCPNGVDLEIFSPEVSRVEALKRLPAKDLADKKVLVYTGSFKTMGQGKGLEEILEALKRLNDKSLFFIAVGGSPKHLLEYRALAESLGLGSQTLFLGHQSQSDLGVMQKAADILLMPFPDKAHYRYFMTPLKMFEYLVAGLPIIASDLPSIREILTEENSFFCRPDDIDSLMESIKEVLGNQTEANKRALRASADAKEYAWQKRAEKIVNFLNQ